MTLAPTGGHRQATTRPLDRPLGDIGSQLTPGAQINLAISLERTHVSEPFIAMGAEECEEGLAEFAQFVRTLIDGISHL